MKKKVLHVLASNKYSGAENVACTIINNDKKYDMFYCSPEGPIKEELDKRNINYIKLKSLTPFALKKIVKDYNIDIIHAHDLKASFISSFLSSRCMVISHLHNNYPFLKKWTIYSIVYSLICNRFYKIAGVSNSIKEEAVFGNKIKDKFYQLYNCVDSVSVLSKAKEKYNKEYDVFFIGRIVEQKNPVRYVELVGKIKKEFKNIQAVMIGEGPLRGEVLKRISELGLENNIDYLGFQSNPYKIIACAKVGVMPSIFEGFGLTAIESMILGKPILNTFVGGLGEIFKGHSEFAIDEKRIVDLLTDQKLYKRYSEVSKAIAKEYCDIKEYIKDVNKLYGGDDND